MMPKRLRAQNATPAILDGVKDQHGAMWIKFGTAASNVWFAVADLLATPSIVFGKLSRVGATLLTAQTQNAFKREVEQWATYRPALVATQPGWLQGVYVFGNGSGVWPEGDNREVIVGFEENAKFEPRGSLEDWQASVGPFAVGQTLPLFVLSYALAGVLLHFVRANHVNPQLELVGPRESGKSSLGILAASVWAGNPASSIGGGESWDLTSNSIDDVKAAHRDGLLFMDEGNLQAVGERERRDFVRRAVFQVAGTSRKRRKGDPVQLEHARLALLSTTNTSLAELLSGAGEDASAARSRMITIRVEQQTLFDVTSPGFGDAEAASEAMVSACQESWGSAAGRFVGHVVAWAARDDAAFRAMLAVMIAEERKGLADHQLPARISQMLALTAVAGLLAQRWRIFDVSWGCPSAVVQRLAQMVPSRAPRAENALSKVEAYLDGVRSNLLDVDQLSRPLSVEQFSTSAGFFRRGSHGTEYLIPTRVFAAAFPDAQRTLQSLRQAGLLRYERGDNPKLSIKAPRAIADGGRVYCIALGRREEAHVAVADQDGITGTPPSTVPPQSRAIRDPGRAHRVTRVRAAPPPTDARQPISQQFEGSRGSPRLRK